MESQVHSWEGLKLSPQDTLEGLPSQGERAGRATHAWLGQKE